MVKLGPLEFTVQTFEGDELARRQVQMPEPGRCADRIEDFFKVLSGGWNHSWEQHKSAVSSMLECLKSDPGDEPRDRYVLLTREDQFWKDHDARPSRVERIRTLEQQQEQEAQQQQQQQPTLLRQQQQQPVQQSSGQQSGQQQQQQPAQRGYSWLWWWRRTPQPLAADAD